MEKKLKKLKIFDFFKIFLIFVFYSCVSVVTVVNFVIYIKVGVNYASLLSLYGLTDGENKTVKSVFSRLAGVEKVLTCHLVHR